MEIDGNDIGIVLKMQLYSLTGVPPDGQTLTGLKGELVKDDRDLSALTEVLCFD